MILSCDKKIGWATKYLLLTLFLFSLVEAQAAMPGGAGLETRVAKLEARAAATSDINSGDNAWLLVSSALVLMMTAPGLILFYGGLGPAEERLGDDDAQHGPHGANLGDLGRRSATVWPLGKETRFSAIRCSISCCGGWPRRLPGLCANRPGPEFYAVPDDVCHHHAGAH